MLHDLAARDAINSDACHFHAVARGRDTEEITPVGATSAPSGYNFVSLRNLIILGYL